MTALFIKVLCMSITAAYIVPAVLLLRLFFRRMPRLYSYLLWMTVFLHLACPFSFESPLRLPADRLPFTHVLESLENTKPQLRSGAAIMTVFSSVDKETDTTDSGISLRPADNTALPAKATLPDNTGFSLLPLLSALWLAVALLLLLYNAGSSILLKKKLRHAAPLSPGVYETAHLQTPFVFGVIRPAIYLPASLEEKNRKFVLTHERIHIRRRDYLIKLLAFSLSCIHWFNPLAWLSFFLMCQDMETACDERVVRQLGFSVRKDYAAALLSLASGKQITFGAPPAFGKNAVRSRVLHVLSCRQPAPWKRALAVCLLASCLLILAAVPTIAMENRLPLTQETTAVPTTAYEQPVMPDEEVPSPDANVRQDSTENSTNYQMPDGFTEPVLHLYMPAFYTENGYSGLSVMSEEAAGLLALRALSELYELTGTQIEECCYFFTNNGSFYFGNSESDLEHSRTFYDRSYGSDTYDQFWSIPTSHIVYAREIWYSPVYQYNLPENPDRMSESDKAIWFLVHSSLYNGQEITGSDRPYSLMPHTWRIFTADGDVYEVYLNEHFDAANDIAGPYPDGIVNH